MPVSKKVLVAALSVLSASAWVVADNSATTTPPPEKHKAKAHKLIKPYSEMTDLTDDEKSKIIELHAAALEKIKAIEAKEKEDIEALLTPDQQKELTQIEEKDAEARKSSRSSKTETTTPPPATPAPAPAK